MNPNDYNPKAREAFAKSLIDIGVSIFKGIILLLTVAPLVAIFKGALNETKNISFLDIINNLTPSTQWLIILLLALAFGSGHFFRKQGLKHLHQMEN